MKCELSLHVHTYTYIHIYMHTYITQKLSGDADIGRFPQVDANKLTFESVILKQVLLYSLHVQDQ